MELIIAVIGALFGVGGIAAILKTRSDNKKTEAEASNTIADTEITIAGGWKVLWESARIEINELRERLVIVEKSEENCKNRLIKLESQGGVNLEKKVAHLIAEEIKKRTGANDG